MNMNEESLLLATSGCEMSNCCKHLSLSTKTDQVNDIHTPPGNVVITCFVIQEDRYGLDHINQIFAALLLINFNFLGHSPRLVMARLLFILCHMRLALTSN